MTVEVDVERIKKAVAAAGPGAPVVEAYDRYLRLGGKLSLDEFVSFLVIFGGAGREG